MRSPADIVLTSRDVAWLKSDLNAMLNDGNNEFIKKKLGAGQYDALMKLVMLAEQRH